MLKTQQKRQTGLLTFQIRGCWKKSKEGWFWRSSPITRDIGYRKWELRSCSKEPKKHKQVQPIRTETLQVKILIIYHIFLPENKKIGQYHGPSSQHLTSVRRRLCKNHLYSSLQRNCILSFYTMPSINVFLYNKYVFLYNIFCMYFTQIYRSIKNNNLKLKSSNFFNTNCWKF